MFSGSPSPNLQPVRLEGRTRTSSIVSSSSSRQSRSIHTPSPRVSPTMLRPQSVSNSSRMSVASGLTASCQDVPDEDPCFRVLLESAQAMPSAIASVDNAFRDLLAPLERQSHPGPANHAQWNRFIQQRWKRLYEDYKELILRSRKLAASEGKANIDYFTGIFADFLADNTIPQDVKRTEIMNYGQRLEQAATNAEQISHDFIELVDQVKHIEGDIGAMKTGTSADPQPQSDLLVSHWNLLMQKLTGLNRLFHAFWDWPKRLKNYIILFLKRKKVDFLVLTRLVLSGFLATGQHIVTESPASLGMLSVMFTSSILRKCISALQDHELTARSELKTLEFQFSGSVLGDAPVSKRDFDVLDRGFSKFGQTWLQIAITIHELNRHLEIATNIATDQLFCQQIFETRRKFNNLRDVLNIYARGLDEAK